MKAQFFSVLFLLSSIIYSQEVIDISVKGISDSKNDGAQQDRLEAILDAKIQACEKAGMKIESKTEVENFQVKYDYVESTSKGVLLPGFQIIDIGYTKDDTYQVVLTGKVEKVDEDGITNKELRYAKTLYEKKKHRECRLILEKLIKDKEKNVPDEHKEQAYYLYIRWGYAFDKEATYDKFTSYYPKSKFIKILAPFIEKTKEPIYDHKFEKTVDKKSWEKLEVTNGDRTYAKVIKLQEDTISFKDISDTEYKVAINYTLHTDKKGELVGNNIVVYLLTNDGEKYEIMDKFRNLTSRTSTAYHISTSGKRFGNLSISNILFKGSVPVKEPATCKLTFTVKQKAF